MKTVIVTVRNWGDLGRLLQSCFLADLSERFMWHLAEMKGENWEWDPARFTKKVMQSDIKLL